MPGDVRSTSGPRPPNIGGTPPRKRNNRKLLIIILGLAGCVLATGVGIFAWKNKSEILRLLHRAPTNPPQAAPVLEFSAFKKLDDFVGVECIYTAKFAEALPVVKGSTTVNLVPNSRLVVQKVLRESGDFDHPGSGGFKLYAMTRGATAILGNTSAPIQLLDTLVVLYPAMGNHDEIIELHLCPVTAFKKAQTLWLDQSFKYAGSQIGGLQIDPGTTVTVTDVTAGHFGAHGVAFDLSIRLPSGQTVHQIINPDNMGLLQPVRP